jgi:hypothetical protein
VLKYAKGVAVNGDCNGSSDNNGSNGNGNNVAMVTVLAVMIMPAWKKAMAMVMMQTVKTITTRRVSGSQDVVSSLLKLSNDQRLVFRLPIAKIDVRVVLALTLIYNYNRVAILQGFDLIVKICAKNI